MKENGPRVIAGFCRTNAHTAKPGPWAQARRSEVGRTGRECKVRFEPLCEMLGGECLHFG